MPLPLSLGRFNTRVTNRVIGPLLVWVPGYGWLFHRGRRTGVEHRTPLMLFRHGRRAVIALTYGRRTQWLRNVLAAGECRFEAPLRGSVRLRRPKVVHDPSRRLVPWFIRPPLAVIGVVDFLVLWEEE